MWTATVAKGQFWAGELPLFRPKQTYLLQIHVTWNDVASSFHPDSLPEVDACTVCRGKSLCACFLSHSCKISWASLDCQCDPEWIQQSRPVVDLGMSGLTPSASRALGQVASGSGVPIGSWAQESWRAQEDLKEADFFQPYASKT